MPIDVNKILEVYGECSNNWSDREIFSGDYVNFGYWSGELVNKTEVTYQDKVDSSKHLYNLVVDSLSLDNEDVLLEVGCGKGAGIIDIISHYPLKQFYALDMNPAQINCAKNNLVNRNVPQKDLVSFLCAESSQTTLANASVNKIFSIESILHFPSVDRFLLEMKRVIEPGGIITISSHLSTGKCSYEKLQNLLPTISDNLENYLPDIQRILHAYHKVGFREIKVQSIGKFVFAGWNKWLRQCNEVAPFSYNYYDAYLSDCIDYYIITATG